MFDTRNVDVQRTRSDKMVQNRPFTQSIYMVENKLCWDASYMYTVGLSKQRKVELDWNGFPCFGSPTALFASQHNVFCTM